MNILKKIYFKVCISIFEIGYKESGESGRLTMQNLDLNPNQKYEVEKIVKKEIKILYDKLAKSYKSKEDPSS